MIKFPSCYGYSLTAAKQGESIKIGFHINCKDNFSPEGKLKMAQNILDNAAYPEVMRRTKAGKLSDDYRLHMVHVLMFADQERNEVLLNEEVRFKGLVKFEEGKTFKPKQVVKMNEINEILGLYPSKNNDPNAAHIMMIKFKDDWHYAADLIYDRDRVRKRFDLARSFFKVANYAMSEKQLGPYVDTLFSATELAIQSILLLHHHPKFSVKQDHDETKVQFAAYAKNGNADVRFADHYGRMKELRDQGRYLNAVHNSSFRINEEEVSKRLALTNEIIKYVEEMLASMDFTRKPPNGEYVAFGQGT